MDVSSKLLLCFQFRANEREVDVTCQDIIIFMAISLCVNCFDAISQFNMI